MLITFEGIDGAGKSTQIARLTTLLKQQGTEVVTLREPGGTETAETIRKILLDKRSAITPIAELLLFSASRAELVQQVVIPALEQGKLVILDRFFDSTTAYQGYGRGIDLQHLHNIITFSTCGLQPDLTFYLDIEPEQALRRKYSQSSIPIAFNEQPDRIESSGLSFYSNVRNGYLEIGRQHPDRFIMIDASKPVSEIHDRIFAILQQRRQTLPQRVTVH